jgi:SHS family lactate transporter-like MFS transporter
MPLAPSSSPPPPFALPWWREPTRKQWLAFGTAWAGWVLDAFDFTIFLLVMPHIAKDFGVKNIATTGSIALTLTARLLGGYVAGSAADRWGRRLPLMISIVGFALCDGAVALAPSFAAILVLRTLFGFFMGAEWATGTTLAMESWPARSRGLASGVLQGSWAVGYLAAGAIAPHVLATHYGWRGLFVVAALPALFVLVARRWVPESDEWKETHGRAGSVRAKLPIGAMLPKLAWACGTMAAGFGAYYGLTGLYPTLLKTELGLTDANVGHLVVLFNLGMLGGSIVTGTLAAKHGTGWAIVFPSLLSLAVIPIYVGAYPALLGVGAFLGGAIAVGFCGVTPLLLTELFPPEGRARLVGIAYHVGSFGAAFVPMTIAAIAQTSGMPLSRAITLVAGVCEIAIAGLVLAPTLRAGARRFAGRRLTAD